ncbi:DUF6387 family protein [Cobetia amphilecti]|uniref:DUF6387 family protein n=1 Tax=Cobetia amphilecti TaxID=1055104 RepID=UPI001C0993FA|nr:DUF6387 family protein [Cobetia amphilecti]MBU3009526.1 hypothetical protein [Cobetia amphilecti]
MKKMIRSVNELPEWFDIRNYDKWSYEDIVKAARAIEGKIVIRGFLYRSCILASDPLSVVIRNAVLEKMESLADCPYDYSYFDILTAVFYAGDSANHGKEYADSRKNEHNERLRLQQTVEKEVRSSLDSSALIDHNEKVDRVTLRDIMHWFEENKDLLEKVEDVSQEISSNNGWDVDAVRREVESNIMIKSWTGADFLCVPGAPTITAELKVIEEYLISLAKKERAVNSLSVRPSEVKKLFNYRVAAYFDLMSWSHLMGVDITKKCMAQALFPNGDYAEVDMMPSKTIGKFIKRLEEGGIDSLVAKAAEL